jgi:hypothetical protein
LTAPTTGTRHLIGLLRDDASRAQLDLETDRFFTVADSPGLSYREKLDVYRDLADAYFDSARYHDFWADKQARLDEIVLDWVASPGFDQLLVRTVRSVYPAHEHDQFIEHLRGLFDLWVREETVRLRTNQ